MGSMSVSTTMNQDLRSSQTGGSYIAPGAVVTQPGGLGISLQGGTGQAAATLTMSGQNTFGYTAEDVGGILQTVTADRSGERTAITGLAASLESSAAQQSQAVNSMLSAAKTPESNTLQQILPVVVVVAVVIGVLAVSRG